MRLLTEPGTRTMLVLAGCLVAFQGWTAPLSAQSKQRLAQSKGSCAAVAERQGSAYMARLKAKDYAAASDIARKTADTCLEAGDIDRARTWFQTARTVGPKTAKGRAADAQWQERYEKALVRLGSPPLHLADAEKRAAAVVAANTARAHVRQPAARRASATSANDGVAASRPFDWQGLFWIAAGGLGVLGMGATALLRRRMRPGI